MIARARARELQPQVAIGLLLVVLAATTFALLAAGGFDVMRALSAMVYGAFGSWYAFASGTLVRATPLVLTGLAVAVAFRAGVFNIGAEGQFLLGAIAAAALALRFSHAPRAILILVILLGGAAAGASWAGIAAILRIRYRVLEVISTIMLNFLAAYTVSYLVRGPLQEPTRVFPQTPTLSAAAQLPRLAPGTRLHVGFVIAIIAAIAVWWGMRHTASGFRLRAVGANAAAAQSAAQVHVEGVLARAFLLSGALAGLAGAIEVSGVTFALYENISPGYGYTAIAVALLARLNAGAVIATGILFGALEAGASAMQRDAGVPSVIVSVLEAGIILALVALQRIRTSNTDRSA